MREREGGVGVTQLASPPLPSVLFPQNTLCPLLLSLQLYYPAALGKFLISVGQLERPPATVNTSRLVDGMTLLAKTLTQERCCDSKLASYFLKKKGINYSTNYFAFLNIRNRMAVIQLCVCVCVDLLVWSGPGSVCEKDPPPVPAILLKRETKCASSPVSTKIT